MSKMVSARIPDALFDQGNFQLEKLGATTSDLIKSAFEYVLKEHALPSSPEPRSSKRQLTKTQTESLRDSLAACSLHLDIPADISYDKRIAREARIERHEALA